MKQSVVIGKTDYTVLVFIPDPASTVGKGKTGLVAATLTVSGTRVETDNDVVVTDYTSSLNDLSALTDAHNDWGVKEVSATLAPGLYRLDLADAIFASGAWSAVIYVCITSGLGGASPMEFILDASDFTVAKATPTNITAGTITTVGTLTTYTGNTPQTGDAYAQTNSGTFGLAAIKTVDDAIKAKTDNLPAAPASTTNITAGTITTVTNLTNAPTNGDLTSAMKASVNSEVVDCLNVDTYAEPGQEAPGATISLAKKLGFLWKFARNKIVQNSTTMKIYADDASTVDQKSTVSDDGTDYTRGEIGTGP